MKGHIKTLVLIFSVTLNVGFLASYVLRRVSERPRYAYEELNLTPQQRSRVLPGRDQFHNRVNEIGNGIIALHMQLLDLLAADSPNRALIDSKLSEIQAGQRSMQQTLVEHLLAEKQIFTPEQCARFFAVLKARTQSQAAPGPPWIPRGAKQGRGPQ